MAARQPLFSMMVTAGVTLLKSQADVGADDWIRISNIQYLTKLTAWLNDSANWPGSGLTPLFLELCRDGAQVALQNEDPLWWGRVYRDDSTQTGREAQQPKNEFEFFQPLEASQLDVQFRHTKPYPGGTIWKPASVEFTWMIEYFPLSLANS